MPGARARRLMRMRSRGLRRLPRPHPAECTGVMTEVRPHRDGQGEMLGRQAQLSPPLAARPRTDWAEAALGVAAVQRRELAHPALEPPAADLPPAKAFP